MNEQYDTVSIMKDVTVDVPGSFSYRWENDDEGQDVLRIYKGKHYDDGNEVFDFSCEITPRHDEDTFFSLSYLEDLLADNEYSGDDDDIGLHLQKVGFIASKTIPVSISRLMTSWDVLGMQVCLSFVLLQIVAGSHDEIMFKICLPEDRDEQQMHECYKILLELAKSVCVRGKDLPVKSITVGRLKKELDADDFYDSFDVSDDIMVEEDTEDVVDGLASMLSDLFASTLFEDFSEDEIALDSIITVEQPEDYYIELGEDQHGNDIIFFVSNDTMFVKDYDTDEFVEVPSYQGTLAYDDPDIYGLSSPITVYGLRKALAARYNQTSPFGEMRFYSMIGSQKDSCFFYGVRIEQEREDDVDLLRLVAGFYVIIDNEKIFHSFANVDISYANDYEMGSFCEGLLAAARSVSIRGNKISLDHISNEDLMRTFDLI